MLNLIPKCVKFFTLKKECADSSLREMYSPYSSNSPFLQLLLHPGEEIPIFLAPYTQDPSLTLSDCPASG